MDTVGPTGCSNVHWRETTGVPVDGPGCVVGTVCCRGRDTVDTVGCYRRLPEDWQWVSLWRDCVLTVVSVGGGACGSVIAGYRTLSHLERWGWSELSRQAPLNWFSCAGVVDGIDGTGQFWTYVGIVRLKYLLWRATWEVTGWDLGLKHVWGSIENLLACNKPRNGGRGAAFIWHF